jgi:hypothetical protein
MKRDRIPAPFRTGSLAAKRKVVMAPEDRKQISNDRGMELHAAFPPPIQFGNRFREWLGQSAWSSRPLIDWLQGYDLPPGGNEDEPYSFVTQECARLDPAQRRSFLERVAALLMEEPDVTRPGTRPNQVLYNLLLLCASLPDGTRLGPGLCSIYTRGRLRGKWLGVNLRDALCSALIANQVDDKLAGLWIDMLDGRKHPFVGGDEFVGFAGLLRKDNPGAPDLKTLGVGLTRLVVLLGEQHLERVIQLKKLIASVLEWHPSWPSWSLDLIKIADEGRWRNWAVDCLPDLWIDPDYPSNKEGHWFIWSLLWRPLNAYALQANLVCEFRAHRCGGRVTEGVLSPEVAKIGRLAANIFENKRKQNEGQNHEFAGETAASLAMIGVEEQLRRKSEDFPNASLIFAWDRKQLNTDLKKRPQLSRSSA